MALTFVKDYKGNRDLRISFNQLAMETFGVAIDFESWYQEGYWNDNYICYSFHDEGRVVSNMSINKMTLVIEGIEKQALQIGTVMTHPDYRKRGLASQLMKEVLKDYKNQVSYIYLFGNDDAKGLYLTWGFEAVQEVNYSLETLDLDPKECEQSLLDISQETDLEFLKKMVNGRQPASKEFGVIKDEHLQMFYYSKFMGQTLYYIKEEDVIVSYEIEEGVLHLYEVISQHPVELKKVLGCIVKSDIHKVIFYFKPDSEDMIIKEELLVVEDQTLLVLEPRDWANASFRVPFYSHA